MPLKFFELCCEHDFPPLAQVLKAKPTPEALRAAARARLDYLARLAATVEREGAELPRDAMRLFAGEVGLLVSEVEVLLGFETDQKT